MQEELHLMKDRDHTEWGPLLSSFSFIGTLSPLAWHIDFKQKAAVLDWGVKRSEFGAARVARCGNRKSQKGGNCKRRWHKICIQTPLKSLNLTVIGYKVNIKKQIVFLFISKKQLENEIYKENLYNCIKNMKYLEINSTKDVQKLYSRN